jgi:hypothetical protein
MTWRYIALGALTLALLYLLHRLDRWLWERGL